MRTFCDIELNVRFAVFSRFGIGKKKIAQQDAHNAMATFDTDQGWTMTRRLSHSLIQNYFAPSSTISYAYVYYTFFFFFFRIYRYVCYIISTRATLHVMLFDPINHFIYNREKKLN